MGLGGPPDPLSKCGIHFGLEVPVQDATNPAVASWTRVLGTVHLNAQTLNP